jgi:serine/threonine-protein kinase
VALGLAVVGVVALRAGVRHDAAAPALSGEVPSEVAQPSAVASAAPASAPPSTASPAPSPNADDAIQPSALPLVPARPARPAPPVRRPPAAQNPACNPPYTVDANGYRKYKRECASE